MKFSDRLDCVLAELRALLLQKNEAYGDSALNPLRIFSRADTASAIRVRIDDKLSRLARGDPGQEDTELDLLGYMVILRMARDNERASDSQDGSPGRCVGCQGDGCESCGVRHGVVGAAPGGPEGQKETPEHVPSNADWVQRVDAWRNRFGPKVSMVHPADPCERRELPETHRCICGAGLRGGHTLGCPFMGS